MSSPMMKQENVSMVAGSIVALVAVNFVVRKSMQNKKNEARYPPKSKIGMSETIEQISGSQYPAFMLRMAKEVGSYTFRINIPILGIPMVLAVGDVDLHRAILKDPDTTRPIDPFYKAFNDVTGGVPSIFTTNGDYWHKRRKLLAPAFASAHLKRMNQVALDKTEIWIKTKLRPLIAKGESFDVGEEMMGIILSAICETAFEYQMPTDEESMYISELDICLQEFLFKSTTNPLRPLLGRLLSERRRAHRAAEKLMDIANNIMRHYETLEKPIENTLIDRIMKSDVYENDRERQADIVFLLFAGHDTTAYTLAWILLELARNPSNIKALRSSLAKLGPEGWSKSPTLMNIIREGMRLHPTPAAGSIRALGKDMTSKEGYFLPKGTVAFMSLILLFRNPEIYAEPDKYQPSRWENPTSEMLDAHLPFSFGKQNCLGQALAKIELQSMVSRICSEFDLEVAEEGTSSFFLTYKPVGARIVARVAS